MSSNIVQRELSIRSESIQRVYNFYKSDSFFVNRRYQRKLIWTIEEKRNFIDSIVKGYPVPIFLLAEVNYENNVVFEIIDGMQRLNAIMSFIEGEFTYNDKYFDLETMVESKSYLDKGELSQELPKIDRNICELVASYVLPLSVYTFNEAHRIDEIFTRINSGGKHLSKQELRTAGALRTFSDLVRVISSEIRTDVSASNILNLSKMREISITNYQLEYGITVDELFWVRENIITKEMVRESKDEEIVADLLASIALADSDYPGTSSVILDEYYGLSDSSRTLHIENAIDKIGVDRLKHEFLQTFDEFRRVLSEANLNFQGLIFQAPAQRLPRYFEILFLSFHKLLFRENKEILNYDQLGKKLNGISDHITITSGGNWSAKNKTDNVNAITGIISDCFSDRAIQDPGSRKWLTEFETILSQSSTEQALYDFKQGLIRLDGENRFDEESFSKIIKTLTAISNNSINAIGYVCVGVADSKNDADRIKELFQIEPTIYRKFYITGVQHEAESLNGSIDNYFQMIVEKIKEQPIDDEAKSLLSKEIKMISYYDKEILIFKVSSIGKPMIYNNKYYQRHGANVAEVQPSEYPVFFQSYK